VVKRRKGRKDMVKRYKKTPKEKLQIVLEGLRGETNITELCRRHGITTAMFYKWKDLFLRKGEEIFSNQGNFSSERILKERIRELERIIGRLTVENEILKKTEEFLKR
jgi:transposase-like protein